MTNIVGFIKDQIKEARINWVSYRYREAIKNNDMLSAERLWQELCGLITSRSDAQIKRMEARHG